jgi:hypothetical protein
MFVIGLVFVGVCIIAIVASRSAPARSMRALLGYTALFWLVSKQAWGMILFLNLDTIGSVGRSFGVYDLDPWFPTIGLVPPLVGAFVFAIALWRRWQRQRG